MRVGFVLAALLPLAAALVPALRASHGGRSSPRRRLAPRDVLEAEFDRLRALPPDLLPRGGVAELQLQTNALRGNSLQPALLAGEERLSVVDQGDCIVVDILSVSRGRGFGRLIYPLIGPMQRRFFRAQLDLVEAACVRDP